MQDCEIIEEDFYNIDNIIVDIFNSKLTLMAGRPNMGITTLALNIAKNVANKKNVLFFSLEHSRENCFKKLNVNDIENLIIIDTPAIIVEDIEERIKNCKGIDLVVIDYDALIETQANLTRIEKIKCIRRKLKQLALALDVPILITNVLNKAPDVRFELGEDARPLLKDFNTDISNFDTIMLLYNEYYYTKNKQKDELEINVIRNNNM